MFKEYSYEDNLYSSYDEDYGDKYARAFRSTPTTKSAGGTTVIIHATLPVFISKQVDGAVHTSIYNDNTPMQLVEGHWINGVETETVLTARGDTVDGNDVIRYEQGCTHFTSFVKWDYELTLLYTYPSLTIYPSTSIYPQGN